MSRENFRSSFLCLVQLVDNQLFQLRFRKLVLFISDVMYSVKKSEKTKGKRNKVRIDINVHHQIPNFLIVKNLKYKGRKT